MHNLVHALPKTQFIDLEYFVNTIDTCTTENFIAFFSANNKSGSYLVLALNPSTVSGISFSAAVPCIWNSVSNNIVSFTPLIISLPAMMSCRCLLTGVHFPIIITEKFITRT